MLGAVLVPVAFEEATRYIPPVSGNPNLVPALQWVVIGLLIILFLWFRPQGILPERRRVILGKRGSPDRAPTAPAEPPVPVIGVPEPAHDGYNPAAADPAVELATRSGAAL